MTQEQMILALFESTIGVVSRVGLDKTTTKQIANGAKLNEVYIYRLFEGKEDLLKKTFDKMDEELSSACLLNLPVMNKKEIAFEERCHILFSAVWKFILGNSDKCKFFIRYFYSPYFSKLSVEGHRTRFDPVVEWMSPAFAEGIDAWMMLNHILNIMLDFAIIVFNGDLPDNDETAEMVFTLVFSSVKPFLHK